MTLDELKTQNIWFLWNYAPGKNGKKTKVPMSASGGVTGTSDNFRDTWTDYDTAIRAKEKLSAAGIGFKVPDNINCPKCGNRLKQIGRQLTLNEFGLYSCPCCNHND